MNIESGIFCVAKANWAGLEKKKWAKKMACDEVLGKYSPYTSQIPVHPIKNFRAHHFCSSRSFYHLFFPCPSMLPTSSTALIPFRLECEVKMLTNRSFTLVLRDFGVDLTCDSVSVRSSRRSSYSDVEFCIFRLLFSFFLLRWKNEWIL